MCTTDTNIPFLSSFSSYFQTLFFGDFREKNQEEVELKNVCAAEFLHLLEAIYPPVDIEAGNEDVIRKNVECLLRLADCYQVDIVIKRCEVYLKNCPIDEVALEDKILYAQDYRLPELLAFKTVDDVKKLHGPSFQSKLNGSPKSCYAEYETHNTSAHNGQGRAENGYPAANNYGLEYVNSQVKLLEAKLNYEKLNFGKKFSDMQNYYRGRINELESKLVASEERFLQVDTFEAERAKLENDKIGLQNQIKNSEYKLEQSEIKRRLDLQVKEEESKKRISELNQQLHAEKQARKKADEELAALNIKVKELEQLVQIKQTENQKVDDQLVNDLRSENKQLKEMEEQCEKNSESQKISEEKYQQMKVKIDKFVTEANEKRQKEIHKTKEEASEKYVREMAKYKDESLMAGEKHHRESVGLKEELRQLNEKLRHKLSQSLIYYNDLTKTKEELAE
uniref:BTB domain-containing protein n=1 Tax=Ditylenchus dipsaci TaxID=166011 RepID=A0A915EF70_9BILA